MRIIDRSTLSDFIFICKFSTYIALKTTAPRTRPGTSLAFSIVWVHAC